MALFTLTNPGAEAGDPTTTGWTVVAGTWGRSQEWNATYPYPVTGGAWFIYCNSTGAAELYQDVDLTTGHTTTELDSGMWGATFDVKHANVANVLDEARVRITWLNTDKTVVVGTSDSALQNVSPIRTYDDLTLYAAIPSGARHARLSLMAYLVAPRTETQHAFDNATFETALDVAISMATLEAHTLVSAPDTGTSVATLGAHTAVGGSDEAMALATFGVHTAIGAPITAVWVATTAQHSAVGGPNTGISIAALGVPIRRFGFPQIVG
jgi:hypothetical protein